LKRRPEFLAVNNGVRVAKPGFVLLGLERGPEAASASDVRYGLTVTKRIGNAVQRNRARRRLRALAQARLSTSGRSGWDYVLIARDAALSRDFTQLEGDLESALEMLHKARRPPIRVSREDGR
jgi:ribonuclease P protein component